MCLFLLAICLGVAGNYVADWESPVVNAVDGRIYTLDWLNSCYRDIPDGKPHVVILNHDTKAKSVVPIASADSPVPSVFEMEITEKERSSPLLRWHLIKDETDDHDSTYAWKLLLEYRVYHYDYDWRQHPSGLVIRKYYKNHIPCSRNEWWRAVLGGQP